MNLIKHPFFKTIAFMEKLNAWNATDDPTFSKSEFLKTLKVAHPFVFDGSITNEKFESSQDLKPLDELVKSFSLPFKTSLYLLTDAPKVSVKNKYGDLLPMFIYGYLIEEITPEKFRVFIMSMQGVTEDIKAATGFDHLPLADEITIDLNLPAEKMMNQNEVCLLCHLTNAISVKRIGVERGGGRFQVKNKQATTGFTSIKYDNIYHIADKREYEFEKPIADGEIDWSYVGYWRGHWRAFYVKSGDETVKDHLGWNKVDYSRTGKDRKGVYCVPGYTWVVEHIKGDPELAEIKTRVVVAG